MADWRIRNSGLGICAVTRVFFCAAFCALSAALFAQEEPAAAPAPEAESAEETAAPPQKPPRAPVLRRPYLSFGGALLFFSSDKSLESDPAPILGSFYGNFSYPLTGSGFFSLYIGASLEVYRTHYLWSDALGRALPAAIEQREAQVFGFPLGIALETRFDLPAKMTLRMSLGLSADMRLVLLAEDINEDLEGPAGMQDLRDRTDKIGRYLWGDMRWLFFETQAGVSMRLWESFSFDIAGRVFMPASAPPREPADPATLGWRFGVLLRVSYTLKARTPPPTEAQPQARARD